jgi:PhnB protein
MQLNPYLFFNGQCEAAFKFYERCLGGKIDAMIKHAGTPAEQHTPPEWRDKILHARVVANGEAVMGSDAPPGHYKEPQGFSVAIQVKDPAEAERTFKALSEKGTIQMPMGETFFAVRFGMLIDQFGIPWMVNCEKAPA